MSDDDQAAMDLGGRRHYFTGELEGYDWDKIMSRRLDDTQRSELYRAGLGAIQESDSMPAVFREIFRDAVVPYGDHRTLALFLDTMNQMVYDDSEKLGDAYEYLLKTAEAQADAGQFRTPRHIIDFIVKIINPQKHEVIIDPACGTAGFLVSAYQHVKSQHELPGGGTSLSVPDLTRLADNLKGYDISPADDQAGHGQHVPTTQNKSPNIDNYDTLTSTDHWNEYADVMLANPPFMTPKGGIRPHSRFRVPARRAEVLFVDYMASHLNEHGRAGIIVPEGIVFQSQNAYRQLRRFLLEESLVAVISLPAGAFNPYSGVKTSILILDKVLAPKTDRVAFFKVENDGYDLGAQRRPIGKDDLPTVTSDIDEYLRRLRNGECLDDFGPQIGFVVAKDRISADADYILSGERYVQTHHRESEYPMTPLSQICELVRGVTYKKGDEVESGGYKVLRANNIDRAKSDLVLTDIKHLSTSVNLSENKKLRANDIFICMASGSKEHIGKVSFIAEDIDYYFGGFMGAVRCEPDLVEPRFLFYQLRNHKFNEFLRNRIAGANINNLNAKILYEFQVPLPPLEVQRELVAEMEGYQRVINDARELIEQTEDEISAAIGRVWES